MFETGVDEMSWDDLSQGRGDWPPVRALHAYRRKVKATYLLSPVVLSPRPVQTPHISSHPSHSSSSHLPPWKAYLVIRSVIETHPGLEPGSPRPVGWGDACWAIFMGFEHEKIHIETSSVLIREVRKTEGGGDVAGLASVRKGYAGACICVPQCICAL